MRTTAKGERSPLFLSFFSSPLCRCAETCASPPAAAALSLSRLYSLVRPWVKPNRQQQGLHNWIQIYSEEKKGKLDYMGYIFPRQRGYADTPAEDEQLITVQVT